VQADDGGGRKLRRAPPPPRGACPQATVELPGIKGVWGLRQGWMDAYDRYLVLSFVGETR
jgi:hypothetical protein